MTERLSQHSMNTLTGGLTLTEEKFAFYKEIARLKQSQSHRDLAELLDSSSTKNDE